MDFQFVTPPVSYAWTSNQTYPKKDKKVSIFTVVVAIPHEGFPLEPMEPTMGWPRGKFAWYYVQDILKKKPKWKI